MVAHELIAQWKTDEAAPVEGWDFSYIARRYIEAEPPWDYLALARAAITKSECVLDMQTGGGERFALLAPFPGRAFATESYAPSFAVAKRRLEPLGVEMRERPGPGLLPLENSFFDLVLNRHGGYRISEIARVLRPGGKVLTQQVVGTTLSDLQARFGAKPKWPDATFESAVAGATAAGLKIVRAEEWNGREAFRDVGAIVYFLKAIPWLVDGFSVDAHLDALSALQDELERKGILTFSAARFLLIAEKP